MITNRSRTEGRLLSVKIPLPPGLVDRAPELTAELREYLRNRPEVAVSKEAPKVYLSSLGSPASSLLMPEITLTCHTNVMVSWKIKGYGDVNGVALAGAAKEIKAARKVVKKCVGCSLEFGARKRREALFHDLYADSVFQFSVVRWSGSISLLVGLVL